VTTQRKLKLPESIVLLQLSSSMSYDEIAEKYGSTPGSIRARVSEAKRQVPRTAPLSGINNIDPTTDQGVYIEALENARDIGWISVMHCADVHFPYHNPAALEVFYKLAESVRPFFIFVGSDEADFNSISHFSYDPDDSTGEPDVLDEYERHHSNHVTRLLAASPDSVLVHILGNHEKRIYDHVLAHAPNLRKTISQKYTEIARAQGRVLWMGEVDTVRVGEGLLVTHGNRATTNAAKSLLEAAAFQVSIMAGHVHRLTQWGVEGEDYDVSAVTSGCLCASPAPYQKRKRSNPFHIGTAIADVNLKSKEVRFNNLKFNVLPDQISVRFERQTFDAGQPRPAGTMTYDRWVASQGRTK